MAARAIKAAYPDALTELVHITTKGDILLDKPLYEIGGKGVFADAVERSLQSGETDAAVHSAKDLPLSLAEGTCVCAVLPRAEPSDVIVTRRGAHLLKAPVIGTSSTRRAAGIRKLYPDAVITDIRGNADTRLDKLAEGKYDAVILAAAGLERLGAGQDERFDFTVIDTGTLVPAPCQGIIAVQARVGETSGLLRRINDADTLMCFEVERRVLELTNAGCSSPVGALAVISGRTITLTVTKDQRRILTESADINERFALAERLVTAL